MVFPGSRLGLISDDTSADADYGADDVEEGEVIPNSGSTPQGGFPEAPLLGGAGGGLKQARIANQGCSEDFSKIAKIY